MTKHDEETAKTISDAINYMGSDPKVIADILANGTHRTLQQSFMRVCWAFIEAEAKNVGECQHDLRNEATVNLCAALVKAMDTDEGFRLKALPFI